MAEPRLRGVGVERVIIATDLDPFLSLRALTAYNGLSIRTLRAHLTDPRRPLPCYRVGVKILVRRSEFDSWMRPHRQVGSADVDRLMAEMFPVPPTRPR
jgi:hypothetical protein